MCASRNTSQPPAGLPADGEVVLLAGVSVLREGRFLLAEVDWQVHDHERWVVLGPNGSGKTTMLQVASTYLAPTRGTVRLLGATRGEVDVGPLRERIGYAGTGPASLIHEYLPALEIVVTGKHAAFVDSRWHDYAAGDWEFARHQLARLNADHLEDRIFATLSAGEKQRVLIARSLVAKPQLLLLDEATTGLDLGAREGLVAALADFAADPASPAVALVTHHVEEIPQGFTHIIMLSEGRVVASGPITETLTAEALRGSFDIDVKLELRDGRYHAWS